MKSFWGLPGYLALCLFYSHFSVAAFKCSGSDGIFARVGGARAVGPAGVSHTEKYEQLFVLPNGDRFVLGVRDVKRVVDGREAKGPKNQTSISLEYQKYKEFYMGGEAGMSGPRFKSSDLKPELQLIETVSNASLKTRTFELPVERLPRNDLERFDIEPAPTFVIQAVIESRKSGAAWKQTSGALNIYEISPSTKRRKKIASISGEGVLDSIQESFRY